MNQNIQTAALPETKSDYNRMFLFVAGLGGLPADTGDHTPGLKPLVVIYSYGDFHATPKVVHSDDFEAALTIDRDSCLPATALAALFKNRLAALTKSRMAPLKIEHAHIPPLPGTETSGKAREKIGPYFLEKK